MRTDSDQPLLAFGMTASERAILARTFNAFQSVSLYGHYGSEHMTGVDARDLSRFPADSMGGLFW